MTYAFKACAHDTVPAINCVVCWTLHRPISCPINSVHRKQTAGIHRSSCDEQSQSAQTTWHWLYTQ